jgi:hypothetical protein
VLPSEVNKTYAVLKGVCAGVSLLLSSCAVDEGFQSPGPNDTGVIACEFATKTMGPQLIDPDDRVYGDGTVQSRRKMQQSFMDCQAALKKAED